MARLAVTLAVVFSLFILSHARLPFNLPANDVISDPKPLTLSSASDSDAGAGNGNVAVTEPLQPIRLPSDRSESESETETISTTADLPASNTNTIAARPLTTATYDVRFRPINRHFQHYTSADSPFRFRFPDRCRHLQKPVTRQWLNEREILYGDDMILPSDRTVRERFVRVIPVRSYGFPGGRSGFVVRDLRVMKPKIKHVQAEKEENQGGFLERFRKFINRF